MLKRFLTFGFGLGAIGVLIASFILELNYRLPGAAKDSFGMVRLEIGLSTIAFVLPTILAIIGFLLGLKKPAGLALLNLFWVDWD
ncbi:MAG: hypothetical protein J0I20_22970 [Chloroflexi bacterium]|nr:hypothetical protein [Chloroflexota bacterium]OJV92115.1 MAG: hypothetical protein BGO39_09300 [Chloroflexi bacterium 54-19]